MICPIYSTDEIPSFNEEVPIPEERIGKTIY